MVTHFEDWYHDPNGMFAPGFCTRHDKPLMSRPYYPDRDSTGITEIYCPWCNAENG